LEFILNFCILFFLIYACSKYIYLNRVYWFLIRVLVLSRVSTRLHAYAICLLRVLLSYLAQLSLFPSIAPGYDKTATTSILDPNDHSCWWAVRQPFKQINEQIFLTEPFLASTTLHSIWYMELHYNRAHFHLQGSIMTGYIQQTNTTIFSDLQYDLFQKSVQRLPKIKAFSRLYILANREFFAS
jgi:hypothetical protein